jgi:G3E family GTPase
VQLKNYNFVFDTRGGGVRQGFYMATQEKYPDRAVYERHFVLVGGFLGAGKTTLIGHFARWLWENGKKVGLVTNDQGQGLVDTDSARLALGAASSARRKSGVEEITGGCFCCRLDELVGAIGRLDADARPEVIVAEPVGSCTDLMATVMLPLERVYHMPFALSPLSVVLDARRALAALGGRRNKRDFHRDVSYVFRKQIEEAEWLVVNKVDLLDEGDLEDLKERLASNFPDKRVFLVSAKSGVGIETWFSALLGSESGPRGLMEMDYQRYAEGEALLGWVNSDAVCRVLEGEPDAFDWGNWLLETGQQIAALLDTEGAEVGHFKMSVVAGARRWRLHQVMSGEAPVLHEEPVVGNDSQDARLLVNLRAEGSAERLEEIVDRGLSAQTAVGVEFSHRAAFQPGEPRPTHRVVELVAD